MMVANRPTEDVLLEILQLRMDAFLRLIQRRIPKIAVLNIAPMALLLARMMTAANVLQVFNFVPMELPFVPMMIVPNVLQAAIIFNIVPTASLLARMTTAANARPAHIPTKAAAIKL